MTKQPIRCAIYTRKSSEEGLDQSFNSLAAQREACRSFILSQKHEGWAVIKDAYDDGGISGGTMDRPGLQRLLKDIQAGTVNVVVVYKVDRLTRSLTDFAKIIEIFDSHSVSFVSVTQQFNTTSSMGRLTLNVLLSFAQFEREITGERIRDKIAASKRKGMWMGGRVPLGYRCVNRQLLTNESEAETVREIFRSYLRLGCLSKLKKHLDASNVRSGVRTSMTGKKYGGASYSRGALHHLLSNRVYIGEIVHGPKHFLGQHDAIVGTQLWDRVASRLAQNDNGHRGEGTGDSSSLLTGLLFDSAGVRFTPTHSRKRGKKYRYYTSQAVIRDSETRPAIARISAQDVETLVVERVHRFLIDPDHFLRRIRNSTNRVLVTRAIHTLGKNWLGFDQAQRHECVQGIVTRVELGDGKIRIEIEQRWLFKYLQIPAANAAGSTSIRLEADFHSFRRGSSVVIEAPNDIRRSNVAVPSIVKAIIRSTNWREGLIRGEFTSLDDIVKQTQLTKAYVRRVLQCAFLSPTVTEAMLAGRHGGWLTLNKLLATVPSIWHEQDQSILNSPIQ
jgi:DNA invertase Pin-like site-specific DNA recombinase